MDDPKLKAVVVVYPIDRFLKNDTFESKEAFFEHLSRKLIEQWNLPPKKRTTVSIGGLSRTNTVVKVAGKNTPVADLIPEYLQNIARSGFGHPRRADIIVHLYLKGKLSKKQINEDLQQAIAISTSHEAITVTKRVAADWPELAKKLVKEFIDVFLETHDPAVRKSILRKLKDLVGYVSVDDLLRLVKDYPELEVTPQLSEQVNDFFKSYAENRKYELNYTHELTDAALSSDLPTSLAALALIGSGYKNTPEYFFLMSSDKSRLAKLISHPSHSRSKLAREVFGRIEEADRVSHNVYDNIPSESTTRSACSTYCKLVDRIAKMTSEEIEEEGKLHGDSALGNEDGYFYLVALKLNVLVDASEVCDTAKSFIADFIRSEKRSIDSQWFGKKWGLPFGNPAALRNFFRDQAKRTSRDKHRNWGMYFSMLAARKLAHLTESPLNEYRWRELADVFDHKLENMITYEVRLNNQDADTGRGSYWDSFSLFAISSGLKSPSPVLVDYLDTLANEEGRTPYAHSWINRKSPVDKNELTEARDIAYMLSMNQRGKRSESELKRAMVRWNFRAPQMRAHSTGAGTHVGGGVAPYYFLPSAIYQGEALSALRSSDPKFVAENEAILRTELLKSISPGGYASIIRIGGHDSQASADGLAALGLQNVLEDRCRKKVKRPDLRRTLLSPSLAVEQPSTKCSHRFMYCGVEKPQNRPTPGWHGGSPALSPEAGRGI